MASRSSHLDATQGREVVYCHACEHEWYKDDRPDTLSCPACHGDITEIISPGNDPRNIDDDNESLPDFLRHHRHHDIDSDPEEEDIEQHIERGPGGFFGQSTIHHAPRPPGYGARPRAQPDDSDAIMNRFSEMLGGMGAGMRGPPGMVGRSGPETLFRHGPESPNVTYQTFTGPGYTGGVSSFTITTGSGPGRVHHARGLGAPGGPDAGFQSIFSDILGGIGPPPMHHEGQPQPPGQGGNADRRSGDLANALNQLFATLINPNAVHGDAVYSQEALDRIITNLMEANPSSNAPAPASEAAITKLPRKKLDEQMLGPELKGECTICIDDMSVGDEVVVLPCNHWFHEECVTLWLKEHNSCPICRAPIDGESAGQPGAATGSNARNEPPAASSSSRPSAADRRRSNLRQARDARADFIRNSGTPYDRRETPRRDSNSPPMNPASVHDSPRVRTPSPSGRGSEQSDRNRDNRSSSSSNPLHWLRDRFGGERRS